MTLLPYTPKQKLSIHETMSAKQTSEQVSNADARLNVTTHKSENSIMSPEAPPPRTHTATVVDFISIEDGQNEPVFTYMEGWRLYLLTIGWV